MSIEKMALVNIVGNMEDLDASLNNAASVNAFILNPPCTILPEPDLYC